MTWRLEQSESGGSGDGETGRGGGGGDWQEARSEQPVFWFGDHIYQTA